MTVAMPVVFSPRISPSNIKKAAVKDRTSPIIYSGKNVFLLLMTGFTVLLEHSLGYVLIVYNLKRYHDNQTS
jgi:hypothetical protein